MKPVIRNFPGKTLVGLKKQMSFAKNSTFQLWSTFMPRRMEIRNTIGQDYYSVQLYPEGFYENFDFGRTFEKWACLEVNQTEEIPDQMESLQIPEGMYAVFIYKGSNEQASEFFKEIFYTWLPTSNYKLDVRPHFEILGAKYKKDSAESEEEVWIPIKDK